MPDASQSWPAISPARLPGCATSADVDGAATLVDGAVDVVDDVLEVAGEPVVVGDDSGVVVAEEVEVASVIAVEESNPSWSSGADGPRLDASDDVEPSSQPTNTRLAIPTVSHSIRTRAITTR